MIMVILLIYLQQIMIMIILLIIIQIIKVHKINSNLLKINDKKIIILTTHYMEEAAVLGNRIGIINSGEMKCVGSSLFLINRFGKYMQLRLVKEQDADNQEIINYIKQRTRNVEYEILSEELIFRIPKDNYTNDNNENNQNLSLSDNEIHNDNNNNPNNNNKNNNNTLFDLASFFKELDNNQKKLKIKSYSASMPTLEDVFLNVAADDTKMKTGHRKFSQVNEDNDRILFETDFKENYNNFSKKFCNDFFTCIKKRILMTIRDMKSIILEILCPIILICVGLLVAQIKFNFSSISYKIDISNLGEQIVLYGHKNGKNYIPNDFNLNKTNITSEFSSFSNEDEENENVIQNFSNVLYNRRNENIYGAMLILNNDNDNNNNNNINYVIYINTIITQGYGEYVIYFANQWINYIYNNNNENENENLNIEVYNKPFPLTAELKTSTDQMGNSLMVFFVSIAFSLIPANFVTLFIKERINNTKHLMKISGLSMLAYWISNFLFELIKYYITAGICIILIKIFDYYVKYFYIFYLLYGPPMIIFTYILSFLFNNEASGQNGLILLNYIFGALGSSVALMFRSSENMKNLGKFFISIFGIIPSFDLAYGYNFLLSHYAIWLI